MAGKGYLDHGLEKIIKALTAPPTARVGIFASGKSSTREAEAVREARAAHAAAQGRGLRALTKETLEMRKAEAEGMQQPNNAQIGAAHEYGAPDRGLPMRSFLRMPLANHFRPKLEQNPKLARATFERCAKDGTLHEFLALIGVLGEATCKEAFTNDGWGTWVGLKPATMTHKTVNNILVESTQLRESITSTVKGSG